MRAILVTLLIAGVGLSARAASPVALNASPTQPAGRSRDASIEEYRTHLTALMTLVEACGKGRDLKNCDPTLVGLDDRIPLGNGAGGERRLVRYGWLRVLFAKALEPDEPEVAGDRKEKDASSRQEAQPAPLKTSQLLRLAETRLARDLAQTEVIPSAAPPYGLERDAMKKVLAGRDFRNLEQPTARDSIL